MNCRPNHKGPWPIRDKCLQQPQPVSCGDTETKMCLSRDRTPQCFWCLIIIFPETAMNIPKREGKSSPMCGQPQVSACWWCIPVSHYSMRLCPESSMNFIISWLCEAAISGYPPCFGHAHISQDVILLFAYFTKIPDSRLHDNVLYIYYYITYFTKYLTPWQ